MTREESQALAEKVLRPLLGDQGLDHIEVSFGDDHDGFPSIFVEAHFRKDGELVAGPANSRAAGDLFRAFFEKGEERFPYLLYRYEDDEIPAE